MTDETTGAEPKAISASFTETYVLLVRDDFSVMILRAEEGGDLDELERGDSLNTTHWISGSLYEDSNDNFRLESDENDVDDEDGGNVLMFLLSDKGGLQVGCPDTKVFCAAKNMLDIPPAQSSKACLHCRRTQLPSSLLICRF